MTKSVIRTPDQRLRVFVSSTLQELAEERRAAREAIEQLHLAPVMFELGARPHPPKELYRAYLDQSHIFIGIYWQKYGWVAPDMDVSGLEDEYNLSAGKPKLIYIKSPAPDREARLKGLLDRIKGDNVSYKYFGSADELRGSIADDLMMMLTEHFEMSGAAAPQPIGPAAPSRPALPTPPTPLIGRDRELTDLLNLICAEEAALITLTGPGGTGKSRLALQVALETTDHFSDGVYFVALAPISDPQLVAPTIAHTLGLREAPDSHSIEAALLNYLRDKHVLLLLDNFEQVLEAAPVVADLLQACSRLKIIVTSRAPLRLRGEREWPVATLALPDIKHLPELTQISQYAAVQLFIQRARDVKPDFTVTNENAPAVAEICYRLDGLPLAIELAAARIKLLTPQAMLTRLDHRLPLLTGGARDLPHRQQTLRNTIDWSYDLLDEDGQRLFRRLAVFVGGWTYETAEAVTNADNALGVDMLDELQLLVDNSLLISRETNSTLRFNMLGTIHDYAQEKLLECGEADVMARQHAATYLALAEEAEPNLMGPDQVQWLNRLEVERDNLRAALNWCAQADRDTGLKIAVALYRFWEMHSHIAEGRTWLESYLARTPEASVLRGRALNSAGAFCDYQGDYPTARRYFEEALSIFKAQNDQRRVAASLNNLAMATAFQLDFAKARALFEESLTLKRATGDIWPIANALDNLSRASVYQHDYESARRYAAEAVTLFRQVGDRTGTAISLGNVADALMHLGDYAGARAAMAESVTLLSEVGEKDGIADSLERFAMLAVLQSEAARAATLFGAADRLRREIGTRPVPPDQVELDEHATQARAQITPEAFDEAWRVGEALTMEEAVQIAMTNDQ